MIPLSATQTRMEYDVFKRKTVSMEALKEYMQFYEQVDTLPSPWIPRC